MTKIMRIAICLCAFVSIVFLWACSGNSDIVEPQKVPIGQFLGASACKSSISLESGEGTWPSQTCLEYTYDGQSTLHLKHTDLLSNCCIEKLIGVVTYEPGHIIITEGEILEGSGCRCLCAYDAEYLIADIPPGTYRITVNELYRYPDYDKLDFTITLSGAVSDSYCVPRSEKGVINPSDE